MQAWRFTGTHEPLVLDDIPAPTEQPGRVIIDVRAAGLCHSDVGILEDEKWLANIPERPVTPGHEIAGVITNVGEGVEGYAVGDRVAVWPMHEFNGYMVDGGFAEQASVAQESLVRIPDGVSFAQAAAATDSGMTSHQAVMGAASVSAGTKLGIIGLGGLGQVGARVAVLNGAELYVAEINEDVWPMAEDIGAARVVRSIRELEDVELEAIVDFAGFGETTADAVEVVSPGGTVVLVGMGRLETTINTWPLILKAVTLKGSVGGTKEDITSVLDWMAQGELDPLLSPIRFDEIADGIDRLAEGKVKGRLVALSEA
jgi:alcohol dehydrogenase, propanol-preferring